MKQPIRLPPDVVLANGRTVTHRLLEEHTSYAGIEAYMKDDGQMSAAEWQEYCEFRRGDTKAWVSASPCRARESP